jgi:tetratricopeptide (TPR) repeat protein
MNQTPHLALDRARERLREAEADRRDPRRRGLFWDAEAWDKIFKQIIELEGNRDRSLQQQIEQARKAGQIDHVQTLLREYDNWIGTDVAWYKARETELRVLRERWDTDHAVEPLEIDQLARHYAQIAYRLRERRVVQGKIAIEILEDRRRQSGAPIVKWPAYWNRLRMEFRAQDAAYRQAYAEPIPPAFNKERLRWCMEIRNRQRATAASKLGRSRNFDRAGLDSAMELVSKQIVDLQPAPPGKLDLAAWASIAVVVAIIFGAVLAFRSMGSNDPDAPNLTDNTAKSTVMPATATSAGSAPVPGLVAAPADARTLDQQGIALLKQARCDQAIELFQQAAAADPSWYQPLNDMAFCLYEQGKLDQAIEQWRMALDRSGQNSPDANAGLGMALYASGRSEEGLRYYQRAIALNDGYRNENTLRSTFSWSDKAIADSRPLREQLTR